MKRGFTLIELLIVIAIIAILALIAIPNFLESQVRAKVARAEADERSIGNAVEAYFVDYNRYPIGYTDVREANKDHPELMPVSKASERCLYSMSLLTTPIAYLSSVFPDPFNNARGYAVDRRNKPAPYYYEDFQSWNAYFSGRVVPPPGDPTLPFPYDYFQKVHAAGYLWAVSSSSPIAKETDVIRAIQGRSPWDTNEDPSKYTYYAYDPSNGTMSDGIICRTNKGAFRGQSPKL